MALSAFYQIANFIVLDLKRLLATMITVALFASFMTFALASSTEAAYEYKEPYMQDVVTRSIEKSWGPYFFGFGNKVTSETIREVWYLNLSGLGITELPDLSDFTSLVDLDLSENPISDISALEGHATLTRLNISKTQVDTLPNIPQLKYLLLAGDQKMDDFTQLEIYPELQGVDLSDTQVETLPSLPSMEALILTNTKITNISILKNSPNLQILWLNDTDIENFSPLLGIKSMTSLRIGSSRKPITPEMIDIIHANKNLTHLMIWGSEIPSISWLADLSNLEEFSLSGPCLNQEETASTLSQMTRLQELGLEHSGLRNIDFLESLTGLGGLTLTSQQLEDIAPLKQLKNLKVLSFNDNQVSDLSAISNLKNLTTLVAENNRIESLKPLSGLSNLQFLNLSGNLITDVSPLSKLTLSIAEFYDNPIEDERKAEKAIPSINLGCKADYERRNEPFRFEDERVQLAFQNALLEHHSDIYQIGAETTYQLAKACTQLNLRNLDLTELPDLSAFTNLKVLLIEGNDISAISQVEQMNLQTFACNSPALTDWSPLYTQTELTTLVMANPAHQLTLDDILFISRNKELTALDLAGKGPIDLSPFAELKNLQLLKLQWDGSLDFSSLKGMKKLETVEINMTNVTVVSGLGSLPSVKTLQLLHCDGTLDLSIASGMKKLEALTVQGATINDFTPLQKNGALKTLWLEKNTFPCDTLSALSKIKKLNMLFITFTPLDDLTSLSGLRNLQYLLLEGCGIKDIEPIGKLTKLIELSLFDNAIKDITPLQSLTKLVTLKLSNNQIESVEPLRKLSKLSGLNIANNIITDISPIEDLALHELVTEGNDLSGSLSTQAEE